MSFFEEFTFIGKKIPNGENADALITVVVYVI